MKLLCIFMVILVTGVSVNCASVDPALQQNQIQNQRFFDLISGIASVIGQLIQQTRHAIENFRNQILQNISDRLMAFEIYLIDSGNAFQNYVQNVQTQLDVLINGRIKPCLSSIPEDIQAVNQETRNNLEQCKKVFQIQLSKIQEEVEKYKVGTQQEIQKSQEKIDICVQEQNFGNKIICAIEASRVVSSAVARIRDNIANTVRTYQAKIGAAFSDTNQCITFRIQEGQVRIAGVLEEARQCLEAPEETTQNTDNETTNPSIDE